MECMMAMLQVIK